MSETKNLPTEHVLSVVTGRLMGAIGGVYEVLNWMTGESLFTHQLPRVGREATPVLLAAFPQFQSAVDEAEQVNTENWQEWRTKWLERFGEYTAVPKLSNDQHERIDPFSEAAEHFPPDRLMIINVATNSPTERTDDNGK